MDLIEMIDRHDGNATRIAKELGVTRQAVEGRMRRAGLSEYAAQLRARAGVSGTRASLRAGSVDPEGERSAIRSALREHGSQASAAASLGMHRRAFQRAMERLGVK